MNLERIKEKQKKLDKAISDTHSITKNDDWFNKVLLALYVEIGELANEIQSFKYWKKNKRIDLNLIKEEYADGLHFLMSFGISNNIRTEIEPVIYSDDLNKQFLKLFSLLNKFQENNSTKLIEEIIGIYLGIAKLLSLSDLEIEEAYLRKNEINFLRIKNNY